MEEEKKQETPTLAPPPGQAEDVYSASTVVGQAPKEILELIARSAEARDAKPAEPSPPKVVMLKTPAAVPVTDFSIPEPTTAKAAVVPEALSSSGLIDDDDWLLPDEVPKPPTLPQNAPQRATPLMPASVQMSAAAPHAAAPFTPQSMTSALSEAADSGSSLDVFASSAAAAPAVPLSRPATPRVDFAPATPAPMTLRPVMPRPVTPRSDFAPPSSRPRTPRADFAPISTSLSNNMAPALGFVAAAPGIPEERASARKLLAAAPDPNVRVSRVDEEIFSVRNPPVEGGAPASDEHGGLSGPPMSGAAHDSPASHGRGTPSAYVGPQLGDPVPEGANPNHLPIAAEPNSMHVPIGQARVPSRTPVGAIIAVGVVLMLLVLGAIVFVVLK